MDVYNRTAPDGEVSWSAPGPGPGARGPLTGIRIIELGSLIAGPFATRLLADLGADVVKVEAPAKPDPLRRWGAHGDDRSLWWAVQSRGKRCITLDLRVPKGQALLRRLAAQADVLVENFRPGTLERWDLGPERLREDNPGLIVARVSGYGQTGPYRERAGFASVAEAMGGLRHINGYPDAPPPRTGISLGDSLASLFAVQGILAALYWRDTARDGTGQDVDVSLVESCFSMLESAVPDYDRLGIVRQASGTGLAGIVPSNIFRARDGRWIVIAANADNVFRRLAAAMGMPELADDPRFHSHDARAEHQEALERLIADWTSRHDAAAAAELLNEHGVPCSPIYTIADIFADPYFTEREMLITMEDPELGSLTAPGVVPKLSATPGAAGWPGRAEPGADNAVVYGDLLGMSPDQMTALAEEGIV
ncbi:MAG: formyl-CoA transferase [Solirubrobacteraceae bacterium]|nr:formyl-CoA transferase [Solirubrobacteraceae bacterium]